MVLTGRMLNADHRTAEDVFGNKIRSTPGGLTQRHAEAEKISGIHLKLIRRGNRLKFHAVEIMKQFLA